MNEVTVTDLIGLLQNESASIDMQFQLWITVTSAVVIASFAAGDHFSRQMKVFIAAMYALASAALGFRYENDASQFLFLNDELKRRGVEYPTFVDLRLLRTLIYISGTVATSMYVFTLRRHKKDAV
jgi:hypothetical protein